MDEQGTIRTQFSYLDPYFHGFLGVQLADPLYVGIRQTAELSSFDEDFDRLYPGVDTKLRLIKENSHIPEIAIGVQSGFGHKRTAGEYIVASKLYQNFDFTAGIGWGRFAGAAHFGNPLKAISDHFDKNRNLDGEDPNEPDDWFTGQHVGFFGGLEYFTPIKGLSLKADWGGDDYEAEKAAFDFQPAAPWSVGLNYKPWEFMDISLASQGTDKIIARLSLQGSIKNWRDRSKHYKADGETPVMLHDNTAEAALQYSPHHSAPTQIGKTAMLMAKNSPENIHKIKITPTSFGLRGPSVNLIRRDLENTQNNISTTEIWHKAEFEHDFKGVQKLRPVQGSKLAFKNFSFRLDNQISISEEDTSLLRRTSLIASMKAPDAIKYFTGGLGLRLNLSDNLGKLRRIRPRSSFPIKSDVYDFADRFFALDHAYTAFTHTIMPNTHASLIAGYIDENFSGAGGELLYRPYNKRYAIGADSWLVQKREPFTFANLGTRDGNLFTAHLNGWYDIPKADTVFAIKAGRYLAEDFGFTTSLTKHFKNGAKLEGYLSISNQEDFDLFGGTTHADHGLRLTLPLGGFKYTQNTETLLTAAPFGRDIAQTVTNPIPLYKASEPFSLSHIAKYWDALND